MNPDVRPDLVEADLSGMWFGGSVRPTGAFFGRLDLTQADLRRAVLRQVDMQYADFSGADLREADLTGAHLAWAQFENASLHGAGFRQAGLQGAGFLKADLTDADFRHADLSHSILSGADLRSCQLSGDENLSFARLDEAMLEGLNFSEIDLGGTNLSGAVLNHADLRNVNVVGEISGRAVPAAFNNTRLRGANLSGTDFTGVDFSGCDLREANLARATLRLADLSGANASKSNFSGTELTGTKLHRANLTAANLSGTDLRNTDLAQTKLKDADLSGANLSKVELAHTDIMGATFTRANLTQANLAGAVLVGTDLHDADLRGANLIDATLDDAELTAAMLWETHRSGWSIKGVKCQHAFWDRDGKEPTHYAPGEFERLYAEGVKIELYYAGGIRRTEIISLPMLLQELEAQNPGCVLRLQSIEDAPGGAKATVVVDQLGDRDPGSLGADLTAEAQELQAVQRRLVEEHALRVKFEAQAEILRDVMTGTMSKAPKISIGRIEQVGSVGDISDDASVHIGQSTHYNLNDLTRIRQLLDGISARHPELQSTLSADRLAELEAVVHSLQSQLTQPRPDRSFIRAALATLKRILEGATSSVVASGWLKILERLL